MSCCCISQEGAHGDGGGDKENTLPHGKAPPDLVFKAVLADERATQEFLKFTQPISRARVLPGVPACVHVWPPRPHARELWPGTVLVARCGRAGLSACCCGRGLSCKPQL